MSKIAAIIGRILLALIFVVSGVTKLMNVGATEQMIQSAGLPGGFALAVGLFELIAGVCLAIGLMVRLVSVLLILFVAAATLFFHNQINDPMQGAMAMKNLAMIGGLLLAFAHSQMWSHYYAITGERRGEIATREAEQRAHEAKLRAARAEGMVEAAHAGAVPADTTYSPTVVRRRRWFDW